MFDLEQAIADWRRKLITAGLSAPGVLDELESHLRDDIDALLRTGINEQQAFETAVARIGEVPMLKGEFTREQKLKSTLLLFALGAYVLVSTVPVLLKLGGFSDVDSAQQRSALAAVVITVGALFAGRSLGRILPIVSKRAVLATTGALVLLLVVWLGIFYRYVMHAELDVSQLVVRILWAMSLIPLFSIILGMEEAAAARTPKTYV